MRKKLITFKVTDQMLEWLVEMMDKGNYDNRSELVRDALEEFLIRERQINSDKEEEKTTIFKRISE